MPPLPSLLTTVYRNAITPLALIRKQNTDSLGRKSLGRLGGTTFTDLKTFCNRVRKMEDQSDTFESMEGRNVYACGDVHGDLTCCCALLRLCNVVDQSGNWIGGNSIVVFCGDLLDRERKPIHLHVENTREEVDLLHYLYDLDQKAKEHDGAVITVLGNHELGRVFQIDHFLKNYIGQQVEGWGGKEKLKKLFRPGGDMAIYFKKRMPLIVRVGPYFFMHGGPGKKPDHNYKTLNQHLKECLESNNKQEMMEPQHVHDVVWDRFYSEHATGTVEEKTCKQGLGTVLRDLGLPKHYKKKMGNLVIGHTIQASLAPYCNKRVWRVDLGMSEVFKRPHLGVLKISDNGEVVEGIVQEKKKPFEGQGRVIRLKG